MTSDLACFAFLANGVILRRRQSNATPPTITTKISGTKMPANKVLLSASVNKNIIVVNKNVRNLQPDTKIQSEINCLT